MTDETRASRTVGDIVQELQHEQKQFNLIIRVLVGLLAITALVMVTLLTTTWNSFSSTQERFESEILRAAASARVSKAEAKYEMSLITSELQSVKADQEAQRKDISLLQNLNRALGSYGRGPDLTTAQLVSRAKEEARRHALGRRLNTTTATLVSSIIELPNVALTPDEMAFLKAMYADWENPDASAPELEQLVAGVTDGGTRALAYAALAQYHFRNRDSIDPAAGPHCNAVTENVRQAGRLGLSALGPLSWSGECLRKRGNSRESLDTFIKALAHLSDPDATEENKSLVGRGAGTTLISEKAAGELEDKEKLDKLMADVRAGLQSAVNVARSRGNAGLETSMAGLMSASSTPMNAARAMITYAASVGPNAASDVLGVYTLENIGFTYVIEGNWRAGYAEAVSLDDTVPSPWNLIVLYICAENMLKDGQPLDDATRQDAQSRSIAARQTLGQFDYSWFNESELSTLLPETYLPTIADLVKSSKQRGETARLAKAALPE